MKRDIVFFFICCLITINADSQRKSFVNLSAEQSKAYTVYHNEPIIFTTGLLNHTLQENLQWNEAADAGLAEISADYRSGKF
jgi:hypothetical protein